MLNELQASEKVYLSFTLDVTNPGGHSSLPTVEMPFTASRKGCHGSPSIGFRCG